MQHQWQQVLDSSLPGRGTPAALGPRHENLLTLRRFCALSACGVPEDMDAANAGRRVDQYDALSTHGKFETFTGQDGKFYFHLLAGNGEKVLASQGYATLASAKTGITSVQANGATSEQVPAARGERRRLVLRAHRGQQPHHRRQRDVRHPVRTRRAA